MLPEAVPTEAPPSGRGQSLELELQPPEPETHGVGDGVGVEDGTGVEVGGGCSFTVTEMVSVWPYTSVLPSKNHSRFPWNLNCPTWFGRPVNSTNFCSPPLTL